MHVLHHQLSPSGEILLRELHKEDSVARIPVVFPLVLWKQRALRLLVVLPVVLLLTSCAFRADLTLHQGERWEYVSVIELTQDEDNGIIGASVRTSVAEWEYEQRPEGITISSERDETVNGVNYELKAEGEGYDLLQQELASNGWSGQVESQPDGTVYLSLPAPWDFYSLVRNDFYLHAGKIVDSNAPRVKSNTAIWTSSDVSVRGLSRIEAIVRPRGRFSLAVIAACIVVLTLAAVAASLVRSRHARATQEEVISDW